MSENFHYHEYDEKGICKLCGMPKRQVQDEIIEESRTLYSVKMRIEEAITLAAGELETSEDSALRDAAFLLRQILAQRGCEEFDPAIRDGKLTSLIELVIYG